MLLAPNTLGDTAGWTNLSTFRSHGGKLLFFRGVSDPWFSALDTVGYYERLATANDGLDATREWGRLFLVPGMGHCAGGQAFDQFDLLTAVVDWLESSRELASARERRRDGGRAPGAQPAALPTPINRPLQRSWRSRGRSVVRVPLTRNPLGVER